MNLEIHLKGEFKKDEKAKDKFEKLLEEIKGLLLWYQIDNTYKEVKAK